MRLISQDGSHDVPYNCTVLEVCRAGKYFNIVCSIISFSDSIVMAQYKTKEKAYKVMEMVRDDQMYVIPRMFIFPKDEDVEV